MRSTTVGQHAGAGAIPLEVLQRAVPLRTGIGLANEPVSTSSAQARACYQQGLAHLHSFTAAGMRQHDPLYGGTSYAAGRVAEQRGDKTGAVKSHQERLERWKNADKDLRDMLDARQRLATLIAAPR